MLRGFLAILIVVSITAAASHGEDCPPSEPASPEVTTPATGVSLSAGTVGGENPGIYYIDNELCQLDGSCIFSIWIYEETNGQEGLQPAQMWCDCTCHQAPSDTIIL